MAVRKVHRRGRVFWRARVVRGGRTATAYRSRKDAALEAEAELLERLTKPPATPVEREVTTFSDFAELFMESAVAENSTAEKNKKRQRLRDHLIPAFGRLRLEQINVAMVDGYKAAKLQLLESSTVANHISLLKRMLNVARDWGLVETVPRIRQVKVHRPDSDFLTFEESERFLAMADALYRPLLTVALRTGLRLGDLRGLQCGDVDLDRRRLRVARAYTQTGWGRPKSGHGRTVDLAWDAAEALRAIIPARATRMALVFPSPSGKPVDEKAVYNACKRACARAGLGRTVGPHKLRHTFASHHAMRGTPLPQIQAWMGHADIKTTMRYAHLCPSQGAKFADAIAPRLKPRLVVDNEPRDDRGVTTGVTSEEDSTQKAR